MDLEGMPLSEIRLIAEGRIDRVARRNRPMMVVERRMITSVGRSKRIRNVGVGGASIRGMHRRYPGASAARAAAGVGGRRLLLRFDRGVDHLAVEEEDIRMPRIGRGEGGQLRPQPRQVGEECQVAAVEEDHSETSKRAEETLTTLAN